MQIYLICLNHTGSFPVLAKVFQVLLYRVQRLINVVHSVLWKNDTNEHIPIFSLSPSSNILSLYNFITDSKSIHYLQILRCLIGHGGTEETLQKFTDQFPCTSGHDARPIFHLFNTNGWKKQWRQFFYNSESCVREILRKIMDLFFLFVQIILSKFKLGWKRGEMEVIDKILNVIRSKVPFRQ